MRDTGAGRIGSWLLKGGWSWTSGSTKDLISPKIGGRLPAALPWPPGMSGGPLEGLMGGAAAAHVPAGVFISFVHAALLTLGVLENHC